MYQGMIVSIVRKCVRLDMSVVENGNECLLFSPRQGAKALSYCQPRRGGSMKVLLRYFLTEKVTKRCCPLAGTMVRWEQ